MTFDYYVLENFGTYKGRQSVDLSSSPSKPIILIGGMNGGGKTTFLDGILLVLYGHRAKTSNRGRASYQDYLLDCMHRGAERDATASITLGFHNFIDGKGAKYVLHRSWKLVGKSVKESLTVSVDGRDDEALSAIWDEVIESYLPYRVANLFLFDGEQVKELAEGGNAAEIIGSALDTLLGIGNVSKLIAAIKQVERRTASSSIYEYDASALVQCKSDISTENSRLETLTASKRDKDIELAEAAKVLSQLRAKFLSDGGDLFRRRDEIQHRKVQLEQQKYFAEAKLHELVSGVLPLTLLLPQVEAIADALHTEGQVLESQTLLRSISDRDTSLLAFCREHSFTLASIRLLEQYLADTRNSLIEQSQKNVVYGDPFELGQQINSVLHRGNTDCVSCQDLITVISGIDAELSVVDEELSRIPEHNQIKPLLDQLNNVEKTYEKCVNDLAQLEDVIAVSKRSLIQLDERFDRLQREYLQSLAENDSIRRLVEFSERSRKTLSEFALCLSKRRMHDLELSVYQCFTKLIAKSRLISRVSIDQSTYEPLLVGATGTAIPLQRLSSGERQLLATSVLWGLAKASNRPFPTVIDTPLGRLDSSHRTNIVRDYLPSASSQVLVLSTDEEIRGAYYQLLSPFVSREYTITHNEQYDCSAITEGYFTNA